MVSHFLPLMLATASIVLLLSNQLIGIVSCLAPCYQRENHRQTLLRHTVSSFVNKASRRRTQNPFSSKTSSTTFKSTLQDLICERLQGDFDNYNQVLYDRQRNMLPREGGGHEHIHCTLLPIQEVFDDNKKKNSNYILAAFYFDGQPQRIFRFRLYQVFSSSTMQPPEKEMVFMKIFILPPDLEGRLRQVATQPTVWPTTVSEYVSRSGRRRQSKEHPFSSKMHDMSSLFQELLRCDISWSRDADPKEHAYAYKRCDEKQVQGAFHAVMVYGEAIVDSITLVPGKSIRILDQLSLWENEFWINDRGFDPETGEFIYGNQRGIPYRLERVTRVAAYPDTNERQGRHVMNDDLEWTLGPDFRTAEEYEMRMSRIGGPSARMNLSKSSESSKTN